MSLSIRNLELRRADGIPLLGPLDLNLGPDERVALVGESGSGKSLLAQALAGWLPPGVVQAGGRIEQGGPNPAWMPQDPASALNPLARLEDHLALLLRVQLGLDTTAALRRALPLLERLRLPTDRAFLRRFPGELSGGQRQRVLLAMLLSVDPAWLILDEPISALDPEVRDDFVDLMNGLQRERALGWLWITHDLAVVPAVSDRMVVLYGGHALEAGPTAQVLAHPRHPYTQRLRDAHLGLPSAESGFLEAPDRRPPGCPFQPRCADSSPGCTPWGAWKGSPSNGFRCRLS